MCWRAKSGETGLDWRDLWGGKEVVILAVSSLRSLFFFELYS